MMQRRVDGEKFIINRCQIVSGQSNCFRTPNYTSIIQDTCFLRLINRFGTANLFIMLKRWSFSFIKRKGRKFSLLDKRLLLIRQKISV